MTGFMCNMEANLDVVVKLESGDVIIFNGNKLYHSITKTYDDEPIFWNKIKKIPEYIKRVNLQYRDSRIFDFDGNDPNVRQLAEINMNNMNSAIICANN
jgi:signal peptidase I